MIPAAAAEQQAWGGRSMSSQGGQKRSRLLRLARSRLLTKVGARRKMRGRSRRNYAPTMAGASNVCGTNPDPAGIGDAHRVRERSRRSRRSKVNFSQPLPPGTVALAKVSPGEYPDFSTMDTDLSALRSAIDQSLEYLQTASSRQFYPYLDITHDRAVATLRAMREILDSSAGRIDWNDQVRRRFDVYQSIDAPAPDNSGYTGRVLFTGYCTPIYDASLTRDGAYQYPLAPRGPAGGRREWQARPAVSDAIGHRVQPQPAGRAGNRVDQDPMAGGMWSACRAQAAAPDGRADLRDRLRRQQRPRLREPRPADGGGWCDARGPANAQGAGGDFVAHPADMDKYLWLNPRYIFFTEAPAGRSDR